MVSTIRTINEPEDLERFFAGYDRMLYLLKKAATIQNDNHFVYITDSIQNEYNRLAREKQWHFKDAIECLYDEIIKNSKGKYRNYLPGTQSCCRKTIKILFLNKHLFDQETTEFADDIVRKMVSLFDVTSPYLDNEARKNDNLDNMEGHDFESWCAELLKGNGFSNITVTKGSGDQGVDIIAEKDEILYAIQCKRYSSDLGNTPVQEVSAGKSFYNCQIGVVMTNSYFTKGAKELAKATGTLLWDRDKLRKMQKTYDMNKSQKYSDS